jgi:hypothetical protein
MTEFAMFCLFAFGLLLGGLLTWWAIKIDVR